MNRIILIFSMILAFNTGFSQSKSFPAKDKLIILDVKETSMDVEGYDGTELIIEPARVSYASVLLLSGGFKKISEGKANNNPLAPVIVKEDANMISVSVPESSCKHLTIRVPRNAHLKLNFIITSADSRVSVKNLMGELEVGGTVQVIKFDNIAGPLTISRGTSANPNSFGTAQKIILSHIRWKTDTVSFKPSNSKDPIVNKPLLNAKEDLVVKVENVAKNTTPLNIRLISAPLINIITTLADVDITLPEDAKATIQINTTSGELYSNLDLKETKPSFPIVKGKYIGQLNGGGPTININTVYGNVYLRKEKP